MAAHITRRRLLGLGALAAVPVAALGVDRVGQPPRTDGTRSPAVVPPGPAPASPTRRSAVVARGGGPVPFRAGQAMLGAYLDLTGLSPQQALDLRRRQLGR